MPRIMFTPAFTSNEASPNVRFPHLIIRTTCSFGNGFRMLRDTVTFLLKKTNSHVFIHNCKILMRSLHSVVM